MANQFSRSWELIQCSAAVLRKDKELLVFPFLSAVAGLLILVSFIPLFMEIPEHQDETLSLTTLGGLYLAEYFVMFFFNSALVGAAMIRMNGGNPGVGDGLRIAWSRFWPIFGYAMIAATVGLLLRVAGRRFGFIGSLVAGLSSVAWTVATYLAVPVLVSRDVGPVDAIKESASLLKKTWGENVISSAGLGFVFYLVYVVLIGFIAFLAGTAFRNGNTELAISIGVVGIIAGTLIGLFHAAMHGVISAALYQYATDGQDNDAFPSGALSHAFKAK